MDAGSYTTQRDVTSRSGLVRRLIRNTYVAAQAPDTPRLRGQALALVVPPGCVVTDWSACWYWSGVDLPNAHLAVPPLSVFRPSDGGRLRNCLVSSGERRFGADDVVPLTGELGITTPLRTAWDLGRLFRPIIALGGMDALMRHAGFAIDELVGGVGRFVDSAVSSSSGASRLSPTAAPRAWASRACAGTGCPWHTCRRPNPRCR